MNHMGSQEDLWTTSSIAAITAPTDSDAAVEPGNDQAGQLGCPFGAQTRVVSRGKPGSSTRCPQVERSPFPATLRPESVRQRLLAMQKVEGSNPFSRSLGSGSTEPQTVSWSPLLAAAPRGVSGPSAHVGRGARTRAVVFAHADTTTSLTSAI
jgi:hypothetical protein